MCFPATDLSSSFHAFTDKLSIKLFNLWQLPVESQLLFIPALIKPQ